MALEGCYSCIKYLMFAFNFLFWILGCVILGVGIWIKVDPSSLKQVAQEDAELKEFFANNSDAAYETVGAYILIVVGSIMMLIGFLGCCGAIRESQCMLATFFVFLSIIFVVLIAVGVYVILAKDQVKPNITKSLEETILKVKDGNEDAKKLMKTIQDKFECCGAGNGQTDYIAAGVPSPSDQQCNIGNIFKPCATSLYERASKNGIIIGGVAIGIAVIMLLGMIFSMLLCCAIRESMA